VLNYREGLKDLVPSGVLGLACGAGIGFFVFPRLGFPRDPNNAGYVSGLFLLAGFELDLGVAASRFLYSKVCRRAR
jgi:hypothetical protein